MAQSWRRSLRVLLSRVAPRWTTARLAERARADSHRNARKLGYHDLNRRLVERFGSVVRAGPFAGVRLSSMAHMEQLGPYLFGRYERVLGPAWEVVLRGDYAQVLDIGARVGYYAIGLARRYPDAEVVAFDPDRWARRAVREMAAANATGNVRAEAFCDPAWVARNLKDPAFVLSDCEGYEAQLFDPATLSRLAEATLLIEIHDHIAPGVGERLREAFEHSHEVRVIRDAGDEAEAPEPPALEFLSEEERKLALDEVRSPQSWLLCVPRTGRNAGIGAV